MDIVWSILYTSISIGLAHLISRGFKLPPWVTPTCAFNNTTSLPLLLLQSLESVGSLELLILDGDTVQNAISRAQSYFLVCAVVSKTMGYAVGPKMLEIQNSTEERGRRLDRDPTSRLDQGEAEAQHRPSTTAANEERDGVNEETTLLVQPVRKTCCTVRDWILQCGRRINSIVPTRMWVPFESPFADVMILCTVVGVVLGVVPPLHRAFFNDSNDGGIFNAWLTSSIKNIGKLFTTLQIFIVGGKLGLSFEQMRSGSGRIPLRAIITIFVFRLILWPAYVIHRHKIGIGLTSPNRISISLIYILARSTGILQNDPILWFSMMLMPAGPPALVISSLAELAKIPESEEIEIAKSLTVSDCAVGQLWISANERRLCMRYRLSYALLLPGH